MSSSKPPTARDPDAPKRLLGYLRVSTDEQADSGAGLAAQRAAILAEAERRDWRLVDVVEDPGVSAKDTRRPGLRRVMERMHAGEADVLLVAKLDRLSRSTLDFLTIMATAQREGWACVALDAPVDPTTPMGEAMVVIQAAFAQLERRLIGQRTREGLAAKRAQGVRLGRRSTLPDDVVARIVRERAEGATLQAIADGLERDEVATGQGGQRWRPSSVRAVLGAAPATELSRS